MPLFRQPLFLPKLVARHLRVGPVPQAHAEVLHAWAGTIRDASITKQKETEIRAPFLHRIFVEVLGYNTFGSGRDVTLMDEQSAGRGSADAALGEFSPETRRIIAPFELKGADTRDLDAIMPGRHKSPVQQAWEYANDTPGCQFVLVSNMVEIRMYAVGYGRLAYESFDLVKVAEDAAEYARFQLLLSAANLISGATQKLLAENAQAEKDITKQLYTDYKTKRVSLIVALAQANEHLPMERVIAHAQTLLDRVLFIAFAEDRRLMPEKTLADTAKSSSLAYADIPLWDQFKGLFKAVDKGLPRRDIPPYNGGLFAVNKELDGLKVPDDALTDLAALGEYDFASEVSVTVLGHIFEQSVADLETLREAAGREDFELKMLETVEPEAAKRGVDGRRKQEGIVYTPDNITAFIVEQTLGTYVTDQREATLVSYLDVKQPRDASGTVRYRKPTKPENEGIPKTVARDRATEYLFWHAWRDRLQQIKVLDPACGSGAFLVAAFDLLDAEYGRVNEQLQAITGSFDVFDIDREILNSNLYGVDLNLESIEITKLSLWLKTARRGKPLESLEANLAVGNSLIAEMNGGAEYSPRAFDWAGAFPAIAAAGGFDVVLGNPPYVRMERITPIKPYLEKNYAVAAERADLYCYFYELGVRLLKNGGRLGFISSSTFFKMGSGEPLRRFLLEKTHIRTLVDFGDLQVFEGVTTYPAVVVLEKMTESNPNHAIRFLGLDQTMPTSLSAEFEQHAGEMPQAQLNSGSWQLEDARLATLRTKLSAGHSRLKEIFGSPLYGIKTGLNEAFVVDRATRDGLIKRDPKSAKLLKPFLEGKDVKKWRIEPQDLWLIYIPKDEIDIDDYPAIKAHLSPFKKNLEARATRQAWFELQQPQTVNLEQFERPKIVYPEISQGRKFSFDHDGLYPSNKVFFLSTDDTHLIALLNSKAVWTYIAGICSPLRGGEWRYELRSQHMETIPIPSMTVAVRRQLTELASLSLEKAEQRRDLQFAFRHRITDLAPVGKTAKLTTKLEEWWNFDFQAFRTEVKKQFKQDIPLTDRDAWEKLFTEQQAKVVALSAEIAVNERKTDDLVYALFDLTTEEIALIEAQ